MSLINFKNILSCTSEDRIHSAKNLLKSKKWLSSKGTDERIICILEFEKPSLITSIDIGNNSTAFIELLVSRSSSDDWTILLPSTNLMSSNTDRNEMRLFKSDDLNKTSLNEKWNRLKIICEQKSKQINQFGLNFIKLYTILDTMDDEEDETENEQKKIGSFFAKKQAEKNLKTNLSDENQSEIMKNIVFVLSGFQNPLRGELRTKATSMGAIYNEDWDEKCTHLICAFPNTPKFTQVEQTGKGFIVNQQWILDCYEQNQFLSEKSYEFKKMNKRKTKDDDESIVSKDTKRRSSIKKKLTTTNEDQIKVDELPDFFHGKHFYVSYGDYDDYTLLDITRVILAYDGILERQINSDVIYVITNRMWNQDFEKISKSNPNINFINLDWLQDCHDANSFVPIDPYLTVR